eukprot:1329835-Heterocapsa_arctica.AAC.1
MRTRAARADRVSRTRQCLLSKELALGRFLLSLVHLKLCKRLLTGFGSDAVERCSVPFAKLFIVFA